MWTERKVTGARHQHSWNRLSWGRAVTGGRRTLHVFPPAKGHWALAMNSELTTNLNVDSESEGRHPFSSPTNV